MQNSGAPVRKGKFRGQEIDISSRRSIELIEETDTCYRVEHFYHNGRYYKAEIPKNSIKSVIGQRFNFSVRMDQKGFKIKNPFVNHAQVRFQLEEGKAVRLYDSAFEEEPTETLKDIVYSVEVTGPIGVKWSLAYAFGDMIAAHRILSLQEVFYERAIASSYKVIQSPPLLLRKAEKDQALDLVVKRSNYAGLNERYYLITLLFRARNCTSEPFFLLDQLLANRYNVIQRAAASFLWRLPLHLRSYLKLRGVIDSSIKMPTLNEELNHLSTDSELLARREKEQAKKKEISASQSEG